MTGGGATWQENALVPITRNGRREDVYWTYSYGPIDDHAAPNGVGGVLVVCTETTEQVLSRQQAARDVERLAQLFEQAPASWRCFAGRTTCSSWSIRPTWHWWDAAISWAGPCARCSRTSKARVSSSCSTACSRRGSLLGLRRARSRSKRLPTARRASD